MSTTSKVTLSDRRINESSGFDYATVHEDLGYTLNDEPGQLFCVEPSTGKTVGTFKLPYALRDGEALRAPGDGYLYILDGGNNDLEFKTVILYRIPEPGRGDSGTIPKDKCKRYVLVYPDNVKRNCEALLFDPQLKRISIITKGSPNGRRFYLPHALYTTRTNQLIADVKAGELITDATYTHSGDHILALQKKLPGKVTVYDRKLKKLDTITVDKLEQSESIAIHPSGLKFTIGSEGNRSPLVTKPIPTKYL